MRFIFWLIGLIVSCLVAFSPEAAMYFTYHLIAPQSDLARCLILAIFWLGGAGTCVAMAFFGMALFAVVNKAVFND